MTTIAPLPSITRASSPTRGLSSVPNPVEDTDISSRRAFLFKSAAAVFVAANAPTLLAQTKPTAEQVPAWYPSLKEAEDKLIKTIKEPSTEDKTGEDVIPLSRLKAQMKNYNNKLDRLGLLGKKLSDDQHKALSNGTKRIDTDGKVTDTPPGTGGIIDKATGELIRFRTGNNDKTDGMFSWRPNSVSHTLIRCEENIANIDELTKKGKLSNSSIRTYLVYKSVESICQKLIGIDQKPNPKQAMAEYALLRQYLKELGFNIEVDDKDPKKYISCTVAFEEKTPKLIHTSPIFKNFLKIALGDIEDAIRFEKQIEAVHIGKNPRP